MVSLVERKKIIRIAITGPESTGKTELCKALAERYQTAWVPEYAREYLTARDGIYEESDLEKIARQQIASEKNLEAKAHQVLFCDTEMLVMKIWSEHKYHRVSNYILEQLNCQKYDAYLLCGTDIPWEKDPLREHPDMRDYFYKKYLTELKTMGVPFSELHGSIDKRVAHVEGLLEQLGISPKN